MAKIRTSNAKAVRVDAFTSIDDCVKAVTGFSSFAEMSWPHNDLPGAGVLDEHEIDAACLAKRPVVLAAASVEGMDDMADAACSACGGRCSTPQDCLQPDPGARGFAFPLEPILTRHPWLGPVLVTCVVVVWTCLDAYLETHP